MQFPGVAGRVEPCNRILLSSVIISVFLFASPAASQSLKILPQGEIYNLDVTQGNAGVTFQCLTDNGKTVAEASLDWFDENNQRIPRSYEGDGDTMHMYTVERGPNTLQMKIPLPDIDNDNGRYMCRGVIDGRNVEASIMLQVFKGIQLVSPTTQYPLLGHDDKINCTTTSSLSTEISWAFHNWKPVSGERYIMNNDYLIIKNFTEADDGTYYCTVTLTNGGDSKIYPIKVIGSQVPVMTGPVTSVPPTPKAGDTVELTCQATGRPAPVYNFYKVEGNNDIPLTPEAVNNGKLILRDITQDTEGQYKCTASNIKGSVSVIFPVDVITTSHLSQEAHRKGDLSEEKLSGLKEGHNQGHEGAGRDQPRGHGNPKGGRRARAA